MGDDVTERDAVADQRAYLNQLLVQEGERVQVQCANSNDFVVGKQTNFHGPVTIITCPTSIPEEHTEKVVINDQIWTTAASKAVHDKLEPKTARGGLNVSAHEISQHENSNDSNRSSQKPGKPDTAFTLRDIKKVALRPYFRLPLMIWILIIFASIAIIISVVWELRRAHTLREIGGRDYVGDESHSYFSKEDWGGLPASSKIKIIEPVPYVVISHTATRFCYTFESCSEHLRNIQKDQMSRTPAFADISVNFLVGGDGFIYEGRGWGIRNSHEGFVGNRNIDISFIGDFSVYDSPTPTQVQAVKKLIVFGVEDCHIHRNYSLVAHNQTSSTLSPGKNVYKIISKWTHFDPDPMSNIDRHKIAPKRYLEKCKPLHGEHKKSDKNSTLPVLIP